MASVLPPESSIVGGSFDASVCAPKAPVENPISAANGRVACAAIAAWTATPPPSDDPGVVYSWEREELRFSVESDLRPHSEIVESSSACAVAESLRSSRGRQREVVDVQRRDSVLGQIADDAVVERREAAAAVEHDRCAAEAMSSAAELGPHRSSLAGEIRPSAARAKTWETARRGIDGQHARKDDRTKKKQERSDRGSRRTHLLPRD